jgi:hypothetical protein
MAATQSPPTARGSDGDAINRGPGGKRTSTSAAPNLFLWGIGGLVLSLAIAFGYPYEMRPIQVAVLASVHSLSGAAIATGISGILNLKTRALVASGPFVVFVLIFWAVLGAGAPGVLPDFGGLFGRGLSEKTR